VAFVISDFLVDEDFADALKITKKRHDIVGLQIVDPLEQDLPDLGLVSTQDMETGAKRWMWLGSKSSRAKLKARFEKQQNDISAQLHKARVDFTSIYTNKEVVKPLVYLFKSRLKK